jgi:hypothetical protein
MLLYALIGLSLALVGIAGLQFTYLFYLDRVDRDRKKLVHDLEMECRRLAKMVKEAEARLVEQEALLERSSLDAAEEAWADIIDER